MIFSAKSAIWKIGSGTSPQTFATIGEMMSFTMGGPTATIQDVTPHNTDTWTRKLATLVDGGEISGDASYDKADATHAFSSGAYADLVALAERDTLITFPTQIAGYLLQSGFFSSFAFNFPVDNVLSVSLAYAVSGPVTAGNIAWV